MKFNTKAAEGGDAHPEGTWDAIVVGCNAKKSKKGHNMLEVTLKTSQGRVKTWLTYLDDYPWMFLKPLYALGLDKAYFNMEPSMEEIADECLKRRALIDVIHEEYQNKPSAKVKAFSPIPDNGIKAPAPESEPVQKQVVDAEPF